MSTEERIGRFRFVICWAEDSTRATKNRAAPVRIIDMNKKDSIDRVWTLLKSSACAC
jgi:hypothetical protein